MVLASCQFASSPVSRGAQAPRSCRCILLQSTGGWIAALPRVGRLPPRSQAWCVPKGALPCVSPLPWNSPASFSGALHAIHYIARICHVHADFGIVPACNAFAACLRGRAHAHAGVPSCATPPPSIPVPDSLRAGAHPFALPCFHGFKLYCVCASLQRTSCCRETTLK